MWLFLLVYIRFNFFSSQRSSCLLLIVNRTENSTQQALIKTKHFATAQKRSRLGVIITMEMHCLWAISNARRTFPSFFFCFRHAIVVLAFLLPPRRERKTFRFYCKTLLGCELLSPPRRLFICFNCAREQFSSVAFVSCFISLHSSPRMTFIFHHKLYACGLYGALLAGLLEAHEMTFLHQFSHTKVNDRKML